MTIETLLPLVTGIIKQVLEYCEGDDQETIDYLTKLLGATEEDKTKIAIAVAKVKAEQELGQKIW